MARKPRELRELSIRNIGVIEEATISFGPGFNVITGETGAGKTMVLTGLSLLSGARADVDLIRQGKDRLIVSAQVAMEEPARGRLQDLLTEHQPEVEEGALLLQRSVAREGRGKAVIGSDPFTASVLGEFAGEFFTIHGQSTNHRLIDRSYQLSLLDQSGVEIVGLLERFRRVLGQMRSKELEIVSLKKALSDRESEITAITRFLAEHARVNPKPDEWLDIEERIKRLDSVEEFIEAFGITVAALDDENEGALVKVENAIRALARIEQSDRAMIDLVLRLRNIGIELKDISQSLHLQFAGIEAQPGEIDQIRERRATLKQFKQRYSSLVDPGDDENAQLNTLISIMDEKRRLLDDLNSGEHRLDQLEMEYQKLHGEMILASKNLRNERKKAATSLELSVNSELGNLGLMGAHFEIKFEELTDNRITHDGADEIELDRKSVV